MKYMLKNILLWSGAALGVFILYVAVAYGPMAYRVTVGLHRYETVPPQLPRLLNDNAILIFSKTNGFRDDESIAASNRALVEIAAARGWSTLVTENAAVFNPNQLHRFKAVVWNSTSGDVLTSEQRAAFKDFLEGGGGFVGIHGAGGDPSYDWQWYADSLIGARFIGHTLKPQFQQATIRIEDSHHPATRGFAPVWTRTDEWYSFASSPRLKGMHVLASLDEKSYSPVMTMPFPISLYRGPLDLRMGDHPVVWVHCVGDGRAFYSALGHQASAYGEPQHRRLLEGAMAWAAGLEGSRCTKGVEVPGDETLVAPSRVNPL